MENLNLKSKKFSYPKIILIAAILLVPIGFSLYLLEKNHIIDIYQKPTNQSEQTGPVNSIDYSPPTDTDDEISDNIKQDDGSPDNNPSTETAITITQAYQDSNSQTLVVRSLIEGTDTGSCELEIIKNGGIILTKSTNVVTQNNIATCQGFNIPISEIPSLGEVTVKLSVMAMNSVTSSSQNIVLEK